MKLDSVYHPAEYNPLKDYFSISRILKTLPLLLIFNTLIAAFLTLTRVEGSFVVSLIMSQSYGISIFFLIVLEKGFTEVKRLPGRIGGLGANGIDLPADLLSDEPELLSIGLSGPHGIYKILQVF